MSTKPRSAKQVPSLSKDRLLLRLLCTGWVWVLCATFALKAPTKCLLFLCGVVWGCVYFATECCSSCSCLSSCVYCRQDEVAFDLGSLRTERFCFLLYLGWCTLVGRTCSFIRLYLCCVGISLNTERHLLFAYVSPPRLQFVCLLLLFEPQGPFRLLCIYVSLIDYRLFSSVPW